MNQEMKDYIDLKIREHIHDGGLAQRVNLFDIFGMFNTITDATALTNTLASTPGSVFEQIFIDTSTATKKLYMYDTIGLVWYSVTIT